MSINARERVEESEDGLMQMTEDAPGTASEVTEQLSGNDPIPGWILGAVTVLVCVIRLIYT
ncbi:MAG: hypothetical protein P8N76_28045 [Pirellulaceae bacterium]|nr:hypothetical protein [Pirellulaceae bacterium]